MSRTHPRISPALPRTQTHPPHPQPADRSSVPNSGALQWWRAPHTGVFSQTPLLPNPPWWRDTAGSRGDYRSELQEETPSGQKKDSSLFCPAGIAAPAQVLLHQWCPQDLRKRKREQSHSLWPHSTCFNLPRQTGGFVHCPPVQVIYWDPSRM